MSMRSSPGHPFDTELPALGAALRGLGFSWRRVGWLAVLIGMNFGFRTLGQDPFRVTPRLELEGERWVLKVNFELPPGHHLYSEHLAFLFSDRGRLEEFELPLPTTHYEVTSRQARLVYSRSFEAIYRFSSVQPEPIVLTVHYQGCEGANCFMPRTRRWRVIGGGVPEEVEVREASDEAPLRGAWKRLVEDFTVVGKGGGLPSSAEWATFLERSIAKPLGEKRLEAVARSRLFLVFGGAALALGLAMRRYALMRRPLPMRLVRGTSAGLMLLALGLVAGFFHERWPASRSLDSAEIAIRGDFTQANENQLAQVLAEAQAKERPVVLYVWSNWSESCGKASRMLGSEPLLGLLQDVTLVRVEAEDLRMSPLREVCGFFSIRNIPAYVVLTPKQRRVAFRSKTDAHVLVEMNK